MAVEWTQLFILVFYVQRREAFRLHDFLSHTGRVWLAALGAAGLMLIALAAAPLPPGWWGFFVQAIIGVSVLGIFYVLFSLHLKLPEMQQLSRRLRR